jgi:hypothetical protein
MGVFQFRQEPSPDHAAMAGLYDPYAGVDHHPEGRDFRLHDSLDEDSGEVAHTRCGTTNTPSNPTRKAACNASIASCIDSHSASSAE